MSEFSGTVIHGMTLKDINLYGLCLVKEMIREGSEVHLVHGQDTNQVHELLTSNC